MQCALVLHNIRSVHNVGSIFRTADAAGVSRIYLTGYTPAPRDRFGRMRADLAKVSLGAEQSVPWTQSEIEPLLRELKESGHMLLAIEQHKRSTDLFAYSLPRASRIAILLGSETEGLPDAILREADRILEIPMRGRKESLNVSVSAGIALFTLLHRREK
jgi:23S rRNA (guanosine2251-2'-O)-methyltransferase